MENTKSRPDLITLLAEHDEIQQRIQAIEDDNERNAEYRATEFRVNEITEIVRENPPKTLAEMRALARSIVVDTPDFFDCSDSFFGQFNGGLMSSLINGLVAAP